MSYDWKGIGAEGLAAMVLFAFFAAMAIIGYDFIADRSAPTLVVRIGLPVVAVVGFLVGSIHQLLEQQRAIVVT